MPLVASRSLRPLITRPGQWAIPAHIIAGRRVGGYKFISIQQTPATDTAVIDVKGKQNSVSSPDATFEVLGSPFSLLSISLSPSQDLYTRRGTLVGLSGEPDNVVSTLRILNPIRRGLIGIPFLYQKITSTAPIAALVSTKSPLTSCVILQLDGTTDWKLAQRRALLAWTGKTLSVSPSIRQKLSLAFWGSSDVTGRGLLALVGEGQTYSIDLQPGQSYTVHPANVLAYTTAGTSSTGPTPLPQPFRFKSSNIRFQIPLQLGNWFPDSQFVRNLKTSDTWKFFSNITLRIKTWSRRTIWGDRLFLRFEGPTTVLIQSRAARVSEVLTNDDVNEIADAPAGSVQSTVRNVRIAAEKETVPKSVPGLDQSRTGIQGATTSAETSSEAPKPSDTKLTVKSVAPDGKVAFEAVSGSSPLKQNKAQGQQ